MVGICYADVTANEEAATGWRFPRFRGSCGGRLPLSLLSRHICYLPAVDSQGVNVCECESEYVSVSGCVSEGV